jgi:hypothetical protein
MKLATPSHRQQFDAILSKAGYKPTLFASLGRPLMEPVTSEQLVKILTKAA